MRWRQLIRPGDWLMLLAGVAGCAFFFQQAWQSGAAEKVLIRQGGGIFAEHDLSHNRRFAVPGPLGVTEIVVEKRRVRVVSDPGPRQYCVRQGWLVRAGEIAICAPNQVSVQILGGRGAYDSISY